MFSWNSKLVISLVCVERVAFLLTLLQGIVFDVKQKLLVGRWFVDSIRKILKE